VSIYNGYRDETKDLAELVARAVLLIKPHTYEFDSIVVTGVSGLIVGAPVALALGMPLVIIRKQDEQAHTSLNPGIGLIGYRYLFLDDFMSSGATRNRVATTVNADWEKTNWINSSKPEMVAEYFYCHGVYTALV
jgi:orotate phosphoribosyltransferase